MQCTKKIRDLSRPHHFSTGSNTSFPYAFISVLAVVTNYQCNLKQQTFVLTVLQASEECIWIVLRLGGWVNSCEILILRWESRAHSQFRIKFFLLLVSGRCWQSLACGPSTLIFAPTLIISSLPSPSPCWMKSRVAEDDIPSRSLT